MFKAKLTILNSNLYIYIFKFSFYKVMFWMIEAPNILILLCSKNYKQTHFSSISSNASFPFKFQILFFLHLNIQNKNILISALEYSSIDYEFTIYLKLMINR